MLGFLLINKPSGVTSFSLVSKLRRLTGIKCIGFAGTLDPLASGLMILAIGEATKFLQFLEKMDKVYDVTIKFGEKSDTYDIEGKIQRIEYSKIPSKEEIKSLLEKDFTGQIEQTPPVFSAIKINGKKAYELARKNVQVEMKKRSITIYSIDLLNYEWPFLRLRVHCSSGTYIRSIAYDLGEKLDCGGLVYALKREVVGSWGLEKAINAEKLDINLINQNLIDPASMLKGDICELNENDYQKLANGQTVLITQKIRSDSPYLWAFLNGRNVGLLEPDGVSVKFKKQIIYLKDV